MNWKDRKEREGKASLRPEMTDEEVLLSTIIAQAMNVGRLQYMAVNDLKLKDGKKPGWAAFFTELKKLRTQKNELKVALGWPPDIESSNPQRRK